MDAYFCAFNFPVRGKREVVVAMRQRDGDTITSVFKGEHDLLDSIQKRVANGSTIYADEASSWDNLHARYLTRRINHSEAYSHAGICTNHVESFFSRIRRAEIGMHHRIAGKYLDSYASEMAWRENNRRISNGEQYLIATNAALNSPVSRQWKGYWQRALRGA
jgi:transposase-like protein